MNPRITDLQLPARSEKLKGRVALILGAGTSAPGVSIGKASSIAMACAGASVAALDFNLAAAQEVAQDIESTGAKAIAYRADVSNFDEMQSAIKRVMEDFGRIDIMQINAGIGRVGGPAETTLEDWDRIQKVNVESILIAAKLVAPIMVKQGSGSIIGVSSVAGMRYLGYPHLAYSVTKAAVTHFIKMLAQQYAGDGIRANTIVPGLIDTPRIQKNVAKVFDANADMDNTRRARDRQVPMGRMGTPWEIASVATFLASDDASYITGTEIVVDGGLTGKFV
ncbi:SDR family NAD(P)-dependent oxidoreductase [Zwartia panacis]|uniref:SDR family NAD(P)-dependent oxidoreductase n=1 Tax=Zwartia panacis TaxID=2683345 RepID=UPI0025B3709D|nr:SDR family NAD(P)-dependent oxidoreductase [Zwartia panacis]MDN4017308.1 SDR family NAD(P)-dependent oxidoreductase [Zwartia panacis]